jgi:transcriptional regulator with XRE-family HTH domain
MPDKAHITPKVFKWARESARMSEQIAASKVSVSPDRLIDWENGNSTPTIRQAQNLAKAYRRPFALFFLPDIPQDFQFIQELGLKFSCMF